MPDGTTPEQFFESQLKPLIKAHIGRLAQTALIPSENGDAQSGAVTSKIFRRHFGCEYNTCILAHIHNNHRAHFPNPGMIGELYMSKPYVTNTRVTQGSS